MKALLQVPRDLGLEAGSELLVRESGAANSAPSTGLIVERLPFQSVVGDLTLQIVNKCELYFHGFAPGLVELPKEARSSRIPMHADSEYGVAAIVASINPRKSSA